MKTPSRSISAFYASLLIKSPHHFRKTMMDRLLFIWSASKELAHSLGTAIISLDPGLLEDQEKVTDSCIIDHTASHPDWKNFLKSRIRRRVVHDGGIGELEAYDAYDGIIIVKQEIGVVMIAESGEIVCLVNGKTDHDRPGDMLNLFVFSQIVMVEILLRGKWALVHSGCVGRNGKCLLFAGASGSGKTTNTLRLVSQGWDFYGDDQVVIGYDRDNCLKAWPYWRSVRVSYETCISIPSLRQLADRFSPGMEYHVKLEKIFPISLPGPGIIEAVYFLNKKKKPECVRLDTLEGMQQLGQCFLYFTQSRYADRTLNFLHDITASTPVYSISRGMLNADKNIFGTTHER